MEGGMTMRQALTPARACPPPRDDDLSDEELRARIARDAGLLAHRKGSQHAFAVLQRIAGALEPWSGRA
jgi:hypothetical protein